jgi:putative FmdB family regulatory protein
MPIFEYICQDCGTAFEAIVPNDTSEVSCRKCQGQHVKKQLSTFAVSGASSTTADAPANPCNGCGAARQGTCQMMN